MLYIFYCINIIIIISFLPFSSHALTGSPALTGTGTIVVNIDDVNDNKPAFALSQHFISIPEDAPTGTDVLLVSCSDPDAGLNGVVR